MSTVLRQAVEMARDSATVWPGAEGPGQKDPLSWRRLQEACCPRYLLAWLCCPAKFLLDAEGQLTSQEAHKDPLWMEME